MKILYIAESSKNSLSPGSNRARATIEYLLKESFDVYDFDVSKIKKRSPGIGKRHNVLNSFFDSLKGSIRTLDKTIFSSFFYQQIHKLYKLREEHFDIIFVSYKPPIVIFLGIMGKFLFRAKLVIEYRDLSSLFENKPKFFLIHQVDCLLDRILLCFADRVIVVSPSQARTLKNKFRVNSTVIYNGFDNINPFEQTISINKKTITYIGTLSERRNLSKLNYIQKISSFKLQVLSNENPLLFNPPTDLEIDHIQPVSRSKMFKTIQQSEFLLLIEGIDSKSHANIPSKIFEYISTKNTILFIGSELSDVYDILVKYKNFIHLNKYQNLDSFSITNHDVSKFSRDLQLIKLMGVLYEL
tara:strand:+ start:15854 stop:16921 length:1068 start_codon:yes stop_codon:yes gene_type:complete